VGRGGVFRAKRGSVDMIFDSDCTEFLGVLNESMCNKTSSLRFNLQVLSWIFDVTVVMDHLGWGRFT
jgi:hypothetical protein